MAFFETNDGTSIFYKDWGSGRPVVLVHGWPLQSDMWDYQAIPLIEAGFRVVTYDRRGFGRSAQPGTGYDYDTLAADLATLMDKLDLHDAVLVGFSMGGGEVARYLARNGAGRVAKAALVSSVTPYLLQGPDNPDGVGRDVFDQMIAGLRDDRPGFLAGFGKKFYGAGLLSTSPSTPFLEWTLSMAMQGSIRATLDCVRAFSETDFRGDLQAMSVPTLVIHGDADLTVPIDVAGRAAVKLLPNAELKAYSGAPHGLFYTEREKLNADLLAFCRG